MGDAEMGNAAAVRTRAGTYWAVLVCLSVAGCGAEADDQRTDTLGSMLGDAGVEAVLGDAAGVSPALLDAALAADAGAGELTPDASLPLTPCHVRIMPAGDSITAGYTDAPTWSRPFEYGYRGLLYELLETAFPGRVSFVGASEEPWNGRFGDPRTNGHTSDRLRAVSQDSHRGYGGITMQSLANQIGEWVDADEPDIVLLMAGINDIKYMTGEEPTSTIASASAALTSVLVRRPTTRIIIAQITPYLGVTPALTAYNRAIRSVVVPELRSMGAAVSSVDLHEAMLDGEPSPTAEMFSNAFNHPSADAYERIALAWFEALKPHIEALCD